MSVSLSLGDLEIEVVHKGIKNLHLSVHPPEGRVRIAAPPRMKLDLIRLYAISKLPWIRRQQTALRAQARETPREYVSRESHDVWGKRYLLEVIERESRPSVEVARGALVMHHRPKTSVVKRHEVMSRWYRDQLRAEAMPLVAKWSKRLKLNVRQVFIRSMKTKWGSCNARRRTIRLNTELAKKSLRCLDYVVLHELAHLMDPTHGKRFRTVLDREFPHWNHVRAELNRAPLGFTEWGC